MSLLKKVSWLKITALLLVFTVSFFTGKFIADWGLGGKPQQTTGSDATKTAAELPVNRLNVLLLGIDARPGEKDARTDSMILVSIDKETKKIAMVSIPRDTIVDIPGHGTNKINAANVYGGADLARETVEKLLGVQIPYYVKTNFSGFKDIIDTLGGVNIDVEKRMYYPAEGINLKPGMQRLDGYNALAYVRFRHDALGDIGRTERQQKFLSALAKEMMRPSTIIKAPILIPKLMDAVQTNLGVGDAILVARVAANLDSSNIATATLPGVFYNYKGISYWKMDDSKAKVVLSDLFQGVKLATITGPDVTVPADKTVNSTKKRSDNGQDYATNSDNNNGGPATVQDGTYPGQGGSYSGQDGSYPGQYGTYPGQDGSYPGTGTGGNGTQNSDYPGSNNSVPPDANTGQTGQNNWTNPNGANSGNTNPDASNTSGVNSSGQTQGSQTTNSNTGNSSATVTPQNPGSLPVNSTTTRNSGTPAGSGNTSGQTGAAGTTSGMLPNASIVTEG